MPGLPQPLLAPGAQRDLVEALHDLHHRAGWPSLRVMAGHAGCSPSTVSAVFSAPRLPSWGLLELIVESLGGDVPRIRRLWLAAGEPAPVRPTDLAGRTSELDVVRRHLRTPGLLLVTGEAGIGKTRLVTVAAGGTSGAVATGAGLPLSSLAPLLPLADALRSVPRDALDDALAACPPYVLEEVGRLLPELRQTASFDAHGEWATQRILSALACLLGVLARREDGFALVLEDLHWADTGTLGVLEYVVARRIPVAIVATWRTGDARTSAAHEEWRARISRSTETLALGPLTREETTAQLTLLHGRVPEDATVDRVYARCQGQPLFTEQLASQGDGDGLPGLLADLLDRRLDDATEPEWRVLRALGVADRPLREALLAPVTGLDAAVLADTLRGLRGRQLLTDHDDAGVALRHPLLAEAARRRATSGERATEHRALATALAAATEPSAAEVAAHWQGAGEAAEELVWRLQAARSAQERVALAEAAAQWMRAIEIWPRGLATAGMPPMRRTVATLETIDAIATRNVRHALELARTEELHVGNMSAGEVARLYQRMGDLIGAVGDAEEALGYLRWALRIYEGLPPSTAQVDALERLAGVLSLSGRRAEAAKVSQEAVTAARTMGAPRQLRNLLASHAWYLAAAGQRAAAEQAIVESNRIEVPGGDPMGDVEIAIAHTDILLRAAAPASAVAEAARKALSSVREWCLSTYTTSMLRANVAMALRRGGDVGLAREIIEEDLSKPPDLDNWVAHIELACLDIVAGDLDRARSTTSQLASLGVRGLAHRTELHVVRAELELWEGRPAEALAVVMPALEEASTSEETDSAWLLLTTAARAVGDLGRPDLGLRVQDLLVALDRVGDAAVPALCAAAEAELSRADGSDILADWGRVVAAWDRLGRQHDAAYARWRAADAARRQGQARTAERLLRRAATDARGHLPLLAAMTATTR